MSNDDVFLVPNVPTNQHPTWTTETPTKPGWYWSQTRGGRPQVIELSLELDSRRLTVTQTGAYVGHLEADNHRWAGPLLLPQEGEAMWATTQPPQPRNGEDL
jgi:hypothetical protein